MLNNSNIFEQDACFDPNSITHHQHLMINMENHHQNHQEFNWNHTLHDQILMWNNDNNCLHTQTPPQDLLNLFQLPKFSSSICFSNPTRMGQTSGQIMYDPVLSFPGCGSGFGEMGMERGEQSQLLEFGGGISNKDTKHFVSEKHRRQQLNGKFEALRSLIPNPTKPDRASIVGDAIEYINNLKKTLKELKISVDRKRCNIHRMKKLKTDDESNFDVESSYTKSNEHHNSTSTMKSSWLQRKLNDIEIDVRIIDDEVTIKLVQQKKINCLLLVSKVLDELKLDVYHVAGGLIGDFYSYMFNNKTCDGSSVYASSIADKLIEVLDKQYAGN